MGIWSDLKHDKDKCQHCDASLYEHGRREKTVILPLEDQDGDYLECETVLIRCELCNKITPIHYIVTGQTFDWSRLNYAAA